MAKYLLVFGEFIRIIIKEITILNGNCSQNIIIQLKKKSIIDIITYMVVMNY